MLTLVFARLGRLVARRPRRTLFVWLVVAVGCYLLATLGVGGGGALFDRVDSGAPEVAGSESAQGAALLNEHSADGGSVTLLVGNAPPTTKGMGTALSGLHDDLQAIPGVDSVIDPFVLPDGASSPAARPLIARDKDGFIVVVDLADGLTPDERAAARDAVVDRLRDTGTDLADVAPDATLLVGNDNLTVSAITQQLEDDLRTGEAVALPVALVIMVLVFGGFLAASMPIVGALASIGTGFGVLYAMTTFMDVDATVINVVTVLGIGLSIDYGLLVVSRFREEIARRLADDDTPRTRRRASPVRDALVATLETAGKTVAFSAVTVAISVASLAVFKPELMRAIGIAGTAVILLAVASALTLVPSLLAMSGTRLARPGVLGRIPGIRSVLRRTSDVTSDHGVFSRLAGRVQRHPLLVMVGCLAVLGLLAAPALGLQLRNSGIELLPTSSEPRQFVSALSEQYPGARSPEVQVVVVGSADDAKALATQLAEIDGVTSVDAPQTAGDVTLLGVRTEATDPGAQEVVDVVHAARALRDDGTTATYYVIGQAAGQIDFATALGDRVWWAVGIVAVATLVLLFLMTGSVVLPVKALLTNAISLFASLGVLVWVFQEGHLSGLLGFTSAGGIEIYVVALVVAFAFGLAMDYEVFLISRIKEIHDSGVPTREAVQLGLQRSGRIITSAALIIVVVFAGFAAGKLLVTKEIGFALAIAVIIDATIVRMLLVPATMTVLGRANWWAPRFLRRITDHTAVRGLRG
ncbi:MMPL family transporter [Luteimicrobium subarcticum]|uniref:RND superfamily putative drug exporter n=1 Tax=Luteimicrobium subarcticum TaxID=620910 RepID=A0A2M8W3X8_9MICO|nr:MMPL family transporter [Luteimicrobium subarcticum]PJI85636.1 RND superfamily putative drug exporter [Luteimicrobium subarcticum]